MYTHCKTIVTIENSRLDCDQLQAREGRQRLHYELRIASANLRSPEVSRSLIYYFRLSQSFYSECTIDWPLFPKSLENCLPTLRSLYFI